MIDIRISMTPDRYQILLRRVIWSGILVNLSFAVPALFTPVALIGVLGLGENAAAPGIWLRNAGMLLVVVSGFHALVASNPLGVVGFSRWLVVARFMAAAFWAWLVVGVGLPDVLWYLFAVDLVLGLACGFLLLRGLAGANVSPS